MDNKRRLIRIEAGDFLQIQPINEAAGKHKGKSKDFSLMGVCFTSEIEWTSGQVLLIDYFIPDEMDSVRLKSVVVWSEFIDSENGYFCGGEIIEIEAEKQEKFANYYLKKLKERFLCE